MTERKLATLRDVAFSAYCGKPVPAALDLVRDLVFGAVDYARELGFQPHADFPATASRLGEWTGRDGVGVSAFGWLMLPRRLARGKMVAASMIIATVMNLLHFRG